MIEEYKEKKFIEEIDPTDYSGCIQGKRNHTTAHLCLMLLVIQRGEGNLSMTVYTQAHLLSLTTKLHDLLLTFRSNSFAVISDISKAFHRVIIHPEHRK